MRLERPRPSHRRARVSVVVPCHNYARFLPQAVGSALEQPGVDVEVVVVDDASTDDTAEVAAALASADERVTVLHHPVNLGHIRTYNDGLAAATGELVTLLSADDLLAPGALDRAAAVFAAHPRVGMVYGLPLGFSQVPPGPRRRPETWTVWPGHQWLAALCWRGRNFVMSPEVVLRADVVRQVGGYAESLPHSGDLAYWIRVAACSDVARVNGPSQAYYRDHGGNMHLTDFATMLVDLRHRWAAFEVLLDPEVCATVPDGRRLLAHARRAMSREAVALARRERAGGDGAAAAALLDLAGELWPGASDPVPAWFPAPSRLPRPVERGARRVTEHLRWRVWAEAGVR